MSTAPTQKEQHRMFLFQKHDINEIGIIDTTDATYTPFPRFTLGAHMFHQPVAPQFYIIPGPGHRYY
jgi:hypothetical protein